MRRRGLSDLSLLLVGVTIILVLATYFIPFEFPVIDWKQSRASELRPPTPEESGSRLIIMVVIDLIAYIGALTFFNWREGDKILPDDGLLPIDGEPIEGELLLPVKVLGCSPEKDGTLDDDKQGVE